MAPAGRNDYHDRQVAVVRERHGTINFRFKMCGFLCQRFRYLLEKHGVVLKFIANVVKLTIYNGDNSFEVEHSEQPLLDVNKYIKQTNILRSITEFLSCFFMKNIQK